MNKWTTRFLISALPVLMATMAVADDHPYTEGTVTEVTYIRTKPGMFDEYMKWVDTTRKQEMEEYKKAGVIQSYEVYQAFPRTPHDPDLILTTTYKNMAALDDLQAKTDPIDKKIWGSMESATKASVDREKLREVLGSELVRELKLK